MNALIDLFEALSGSILPWIWLALATLLAAVFGYLAIRGLQSGSSSRKGTQMSMNQTDGQQSQTPKIITKLLEKWKAARDYAETLKGGPNSSGTWAGWFDEEKILCGEFLTAKQTLADEENSRKLKYPTAAKRYLKIMNELDRHPHSAAVWLGLFFLLMAEAIGFALMFADSQFDWLPAAYVPWVATIVAALIASLAMFFAHKTGILVYKQGYAREAHLNAPDHALERTQELMLGEEDLDGPDAKDPKKELLPQSTRIANRSKYVYAAAGEANRSSGSRTSGILTPRLPRAFWIYCVVVLGVALFVGGLRFKQIDNFYEKQANRELAIATAESSAEKENSPSIPPGISQSREEAKTVVTNEMIDSERKGKQIAAIIFVMIFVIAQTLGVVLSASRGFASDEGEKAYWRIRKFSNLHGDLSDEQWEEIVKNETKSADRYAQDALATWQLGLQTVYGGKARKVDNPEFFKNCVFNTGSRTYATYQRLICIDNTHVSPDDLEDRASPGTQSIGKEILTTDYSEASSSSKAVEYYVSTTTGEEQVLRDDLGSLALMIQAGKFQNPSALYVRLAGQRGPYQPWPEFARKMTS